MIAIGWRAFPWDSIPLVKFSNLSAMNQFPYTLEQEIVKKMTPSHKNYRMDPSATYNPVLDNLHDATPIQDL